MQQSKNDVWVGLFVMLGAAALIFLSLQAANLLSLNFESGYRVTARFDNIGGLKPQAAVRSAGVVVGRVESITFDDKNYQASVTLLLQERIPKASAIVHPQAREAQVSRRLEGRAPQPAWRVLTNPNTPVPEVHLLSNGRYHVMVSAAGGGALRRSTTLSPIDGGWSSGRSTTRIAMRSATCESCSSPSGKRSSITRCVTGCSTEIRRYNRTSSPARTPSSLPRSISTSLPSMRSTVPGSPVTARMLPSGPAARLQTISASGW